VSVLFRFAIIALLISSSILPAAARKKHRELTPNKPNIEAATRLQIFLDRANFSPGKLDGTYNESLGKRSRSIGNRAANNRSPLPTGKIKSNVALNVTGLDLDSAGPVFVPYTVTDADLASVGPLPSSVPAQAKLKFLPYRDAADAIAEKFHSDVHLLEQLNPGKMKTIKAGDQLKVPNVEPFELGSVKEIKPGSEINAQPANEVEYQPESKVKTRTRTISRRKTKHHQRRSSLRSTPKPTCLEYFKAKSSSLPIQSRSAPRIRLRPLANGK
jgi:hypothetical protein